jgi:hypothetical protein
VQAAVNVIDSPAYGLPLLDVTVHDGGAVGRGCQFTDALAVAPVPNRIDAGDRVALHACVGGRCEAARRGLAQPVHT